MKRNVNLSEISDGHLYDSESLVRLGCNDCEGCWSCCQDMGTTVILDPLDIYHLTSNLKMTFEQLLAAGAIELNVVDGVILPNLKMSGPDERCGFLSSEGRCRIHEFRPGICRLFPLGRYYEDHSFKYFLQVHECKKENRSKIKVKKWLGITDLKKYEKFVTQWHYFLNAAEQAVQKCGEHEQAKQINLFILNLFYLTAFDNTRDFYAQFDLRKEQGDAFINRIL